jgi:hypothetical protein
MGYQFSNGTKLNPSLPWTHPATGAHYPANFLQHLTVSDRESLGITYVAETNQVWDHDFYWGYDSDNNLIPKQLDDEAILDVDGNDTGEIQIGLKTLWKAKQNDIATSLIGESDKRIIKALDEATSFAEFRAAKPANYTTYRAAVRTACNTRQAEIDACTTVEQLRELLKGSAQVQQTDDDGNLVMIANPALATAWPELAES